MNNLFLKFFNNKRYLQNKLNNKKNKEIKVYLEKIKPRLEEISEIILSKEEISFLHSGHLGDVINSLPLIKELSKKKKCKLNIQLNKILPNNENGMYGKYFLTKDPVNKLLPLLNKQSYLNEVSIYDKQKIDIDLDFFRELPLNFNIDSVRWYFHLTGIHFDLSDNYITVEPHKEIRNKVIIMRSPRRHNHLINYKFINQYKNLLFLGLENEFYELKKEIPKLEFYNCKDFFEMAQIIKSCKLFIGNLSFGYALAEAIKVPRLLESGPNFPLVYPNGNNGFDFYFQNHFEQLVKKLI